MEAMEATIRSTLTEALTEPTDVASTDRARDENGRFVAATDAVIPPTGTDGVPPVQEGAPVAAEETVPEVVIPDGYAAIPALAEEKVGGRFKVSDAEGEIVPPDLTWELTANGKPRTLTTDKLVAYAQMGVYNHEREVVVQETQARTKQVETQLAEVHRAVDERDQQIERLLSDPDYLLRAQLAYEQQSTPEARLQREREQFQRERDEVQQTQFHAQSVNFVDNELAPALEQIATALSSVSREELAARLYLAADPYRKNGMIVPEGFAPIKAYLLSDIIPWAQQLHEHRQSERVAPKREAAATVDAVKANAQAEAERLRIRAQKARNAGARTLKPAGTVGAIGGTPAINPASIRSNKDAESAVIGGTLAAIRAG